ncbi:MAG: PDC sensor domain-containing protein, partial [Ardenticatenaceae bacterium]
MRFWRKSLQARLVTYFLFLSLVTVALVAWVAFLRAREALEDSVIDRLNAAATVKEEELAHWVQGQSQGVASIAQSRKVLQEAALLLSPDSASPDLGAAYASLSEHLVDRIQGFGVVLERPSGESDAFAVSVTTGDTNLSAISILDPREGRIVLSTDPTIEGQIHGNQPYFLNGMAQTYVHNIYASPVSGEPAITVATPLRDEFDEVFGVLTADLDLESMDAIMQSRVGIGST